MNRCVQPCPGMPRLTRDEFGWYECGMVRTEVIRNKK